MNAERLLLKEFDRVAEAPDAVARLRRFVLDLAVRGKLVEQDQKEEPAEKLLSKIRTEKSKMVDAGKAKKDKPSPNSTESDYPFGLPKNWAWSCLAEIGFINPRNSANDDVKASFVPMTLIASQYGILHKHETVMWGEIKSGYTHFADGDVGLAKITPCFENGKSTVFQQLAGGIGAGTTELHVVRPVFVNTEYILIFLKCPHFIASGIPKMTGTAGQKRVPTEYFAFAPFPLPPLAEQRRIVAKVDELMGLCDRLEAAQGERERRRERLAAASLNRLNQPAEDAATFSAHARFHIQHLPRLTLHPDHIPPLRQTILNLAVRGKLVEQNQKEKPVSIISTTGEQKGKTRLPIDENEFPFVIPSNWTWFRLGDVGDWGSGTTPPRGNHEFYGGEIPWLKSGELNDNRQLKGSEETVTELAISKFSFRENLPGDVLIAMYGATIGKVAVLAQKAVTNQAVCGCTPIPDLFNHYLFLFLMSRRAQFHSASEGGAQPNISKAKIINTTIPLPPLAEQKRIVAKVEELMGVCDRLEAQLESAQADSRRLLDAVLHEALEAR